MLGEHVALDCLESTMQIRLVWTYRILLSLPPTCWEHKLEPPHLASSSNKSLVMSCWYKLCILLSLNLLSVSFHVSTKVHTQAHQNQTTCILLLFSRPSQGRASWAYAQVDNAIHSGKLRASCTSSREKNPKLDVFSFLVHTEVVSSPCYSL